MIFFLRSLLNVLRLVFTISRLCFKCASISIAGGGVMSDSGAAQGVRLPSGHTGLAGQPN